ncbi:MAG: hypothetical protein AAGE80_10810 [Pseudomonadota bacterium]
MRLTGVFFGLLLGSLAVATPATALIARCVGEEQRECRNQLMQELCFSELDRHLSALKERAAKQGYSRKRVLIELLKIEDSLKGIC